VTRLPESKVSSVSAAASRHWTSARQIWSALTEGSANRRIFGASVTILIMTLAVKGVTFVKEVVVAARFGTADELDAFLIAFLIPTLVINVLGVTLGAVFIPAYVAIRESRGVEPANRLVGEMVLWMSAGLAMALLLLALAAPLYLPLLASGFSDPKRALVQQLLWWLTPLGVVSSVRTLWGAALNADERFGLMSLVGVLTPIALIACLFALPGMGVYSLVLGLTAGGIAEAVCLGIALNRQGVPLWPHSFTLSDDLRHTIRQWLPMTTGAIFMSGAALVDQILAARLAPGSVAALDYGNRIVAVIAGLGVTTLGIAIVPYFAQLVARAQWQELAHVVKRWLGLVAATTIPVVLIMVVFAAPIIEAGFERGAFSAEDTALVARVQMLLSLQLPFHIAGIVLVRLVSALQANHALAWISLANVLIKVPLALVLMRLFGLPGIALATSVMHAASFGMLWWYVARRWAGHSA